jgi:3-methyladenine DNA glycosylase/8-oxoguanine DNA glycosylase
MRFAFRVWSRTVCPIDPPNVSPCELPSGLVAADPAPLIGQNDRPDRATIVSPRDAIDLGLTLRPLWWAPRGPAGPGLWRAARTPFGAATLHLVPRAGQISVEAWGPGPEWAVDAAPDLVGARDSEAGFDPGTGLVRELRHRLRGLRIPRTRGVFDALLPTILSQKVQGVDALRSYRGIVRRWGEPAPGPAGRGGLRIPPDPGTLAALPSHDLHPLGVEMRRAAFVRLAAGEAVRLERAADLPVAEARRVLRSVPGVGPWTEAEVAGVAFGDPDAVSVGDYHLPHTVAWALASEPRGDDARMLELLAPFAGHRGRVIRLIEAAGIAAPRFGPRLALRPIAPI